MKRFHYASIRIEQSEYQQMTHAQLKAQLQMLRDRLPIPAGTTVHLRVNRVRNAPRVHLLMTAMA